MMHRDSRTHEGRYEPIADGGGNRRGSRTSPSLAVAATGAGVPPPLEAAWFDVVTSPRQSNGADGSDEVFPAPRGAAGDPTT